MCPYTALDDLTNFSSYFFMNQVPSYWPALETLRAVDSQSIFLKWRALPQECVNGILRGYTIRYYDWYGSSPWRSLSVSADQLQVTVTGLTSCASYYVRISAFTSKGEGPNQYNYIRTCTYFNIFIILPLCSPACVSSQVKDTSSRKTQQNFELYYFHSNTK